MKRHCCHQALAGADMLLTIAAKKLFCRVSEDSVSSLGGIGKPMRKAVLFHMPPYWGYGVRGGYCNDWVLIKAGCFRGAPLPEGRFGGNDMPRAQRRLLRVAEQRAEAPRFFALLVGNILHLPAAMFLH